MGTRQKHWTGHFVACVGAWSRQATARLGGKGRPKEGMLTLTGVLDWRAVLRSALLLLLLLVLLQ
jgi:hypothetical protein